MKQGTKHDTWMTEPPLGTQKLEPRVSRDNLWMCTWANCADKLWRTVRTQKWHARGLCAHKDQGSCGHIHSEESLLRVHVRQNTSPRPLSFGTKQSHQYNLKNKCTMNKTIYFATESAIPATEIHHSCWQLRVTLHACLTNIYCKLFKPSPCHQTKPTNFVYDAKPVLVINLPLWSIVSFSVQWRTDGAQTAPQTQNRPSQSRTSRSTQNFSFRAHSGLVEKSALQSTQFLKKTSGLWHLSKVVLSPPCLRWRAFCKLLLPISKYFLQSEHWFLEEFSQSSKISVFPI